MNRQSTFVFDNTDAEREIQMRRSRTTVTLRPYQVDAVERVFEEWDRGAGSTLVCLPTGAGKSVVFSEVMRRWAGRN